MANRRQVLTYGAVASATAMGLALPSAAVAGLPPFAWVAEQARRRSLSPFRMPPAGPPPSAALGRAIAAPAPTLAAVGGASSGVPLSTVAAWAEAADAGHTTRALLDGPAACLACEVRCTDLDRPEPFAPRTVSLVLFRRARAVPVGFALLAASEDDGPAGLLVRPDPTLAVWHPSEPMGGTDAAIPLPHRAPVGFGVPAGPHGRGCWVELSNRSQPGAICIRGTAGGPREVMWAAGPSAPGESVGAEFTIARPLPNAPRVTWSAHAAAEGGEPRLRAALTLPRAPGDPPRGRARLPTGESIGAAVAPNGSGAWRVTLEIALHPASPAPVRVDLAGTGPLRRVDIHVPRLVPHGIA